MDLQKTFHDSKKTKNLSNEADEILVITEKFFETKSYDEMNNVVWNFEKKARMCFDGESSSRVLIWLVSKYFALCKYDIVSEIVKTICKKRGQLKYVQLKIAEYLYNTLDSIEDRKNLAYIIDLLDVITSSKLFLEVMRARVVLKLSQMKEEEGDIKSAADVLQKVQIETNIYVDEFEKADYLLQQMRLNSLGSDFIRLNIVAKKFNLKKLNAQGFETVKILFNSFILKYYDHINDMHNVFECLYACYQTDWTKVDIKKFQMNQELKKFCDLENSDNIKLKFLKYAIVSLCLVDESLEKNYKIRNLLLELERELINFPDLLNMMKRLHERDITPINSEYHLNLIKDEYFDDDFVFKGKNRKIELLKNTILYRNLINCSHCYSNAHLDSLARINNVDVDTIESVLCKLIRSKLINGQICRPSRVVKFHHNNEYDPIDLWTEQVNQTLDTLNICVDMIEKNKV